MARISLNGEECKSITKTKKSIIALLLIILSKTNDRLGYAILLDVFKH